VHQVGFITRMYRDARLTKELIDNHRLLCTSHKAQHLGTLHSAYSTDVPLLSRESFLHIIQKLYLIIFFFRFATQSPFIPTQNVVYFIMLPCFVHKIFTFLQKLCAKI
jgi:hypothetical protein